MGMGEPRRIVVNWWLAEGVAGALFQLAWWRGAIARRSRVIEDLVHAALEHSASGGPP
jgi:hypothetical protein